MMVGVLHCIPDDGDPWGIVAEVMAEVPSGSYLVLGHPASDMETEAEPATAGLNTKLAQPVTFRPRNQVIRFLDGLEVLEPGLVSYSRWRPGPHAAAQPAPAWCALARKA
jgi:hypothetical protein